jgi:predicted HicB family RNase H-like nuclease
MTNSLAATVPAVRSTSGKTPRRTVRVPDEVWQAAQAKAEARGDNLSDVIRRALERYARSKDKTDGRQP